MKQVVKLGNRISVSFTIFILFISIIGPMVGNEAKDISAMFRLGSDGISFVVIAQGFFLISLISLIGLVLDEAKCLKNMLHLYKFMIVLITSVLLTIGFICIFHWFPIDNIVAWIGFLISFGICVTGSTVFIIYKTKKEDQEVQKLFQSYKQHQKGEREHEND